MWFNDILLEFEDDINIKYMDDKVYENNEDISKILVELVDMNIKGLVIRKIIYLTPITEWQSINSDCQITENCIIETNSGFVSCKDININNDNWLVAVGQYNNKRVFKTDDVTKPTIIHHIFISSDIRRKINVYKFNDEHKLTYIDGSINLKRT